MGIDFVKKSFLNFLEPTLPPAVTTSPTVKSVLKDNKNQFSLLPFVVGAIGGCALLFLSFILGFIALKKRRDIVNQRDGKIKHAYKNFVRNLNFLKLFEIEQESKGGNANHIQADPMANNRRHLNGIIRINITPNPLSEEKVCSLIS